MHEGNDLLDVIRSIPLKGLQSPFNGHSFRSVSIIFPTTCVMCESKTYLWVDSVVCVKCGIYCHRGCMRKQVTICNRLRDGVHTKSDGKKKRRSFGSAQRCVWRYELKKLAAAGNFIKLPKQSVFSIESVNDILTRADTTGESHNATPLPTAAASSLPSNIVLKSNLSLEKRSVINGLEMIVESVLRDPTSLASAALNNFIPKLFSVIRSREETAQSENPLNYIKQFQELLKFSRQCLDALSLAVIACLPMESNDDHLDSVVLTSIVNMCDNYVLLKHCFEGRYLYDELILICDKACAVEDSKLTRAFSTAEDELQAVGEFMPSDRALCLASEDLDNMFSRTTGLNKLRAIVGLLHNITHLEVEDDAILPESCREIGADILLELVIHALNSYYKKVNTFNARLTGTEKKALNWNSQCFFMSYMTAEIPTYSTAKHSHSAEYIDQDVLGSGGWTLGVEGYALATLQTALYSIQHKIDG